MYQLGYVPRCIFDMIHSRPDRGVITFTDGDVWNVFSFVASGRTVIRNNVR